ncbi:hypothetical protein DN397_28210 [Bacillus sp. AY1-10]|nr:hypothetical protein DN397_28210 [Bacillus sp. AY1-10]
MFGDELGNLVVRRIKIGTYARVNKKWNYVCLLVDLFNREIIGYSVGEKKEKRDIEIISQAFATVKINLNRITLLHTD